MGGPAPIPAPKSDDDEDVSWALSTASALWGRGESAEALKWLRRAAETASDANRDLRAVELFKAAADLANANDVERARSVAPPPPGASTPPPPGVAPSAPPPAPAAAPGEPIEKLVSPSRRPPPPPRRAGSLSGASEPPPPMPQPAASPSRVPDPPHGAQNAPARPGSLPPIQQPLVAALASPHALGAPLAAGPLAGRPLQNLPQRKQPIIVPPVVAAASSALRTGRGSMPSIPADPKAAAPASTGRESVPDDPPTKQMTPQQAASLSRRARTASRTKGLVSLAHGGAQQKERTRTKTERGERSAAEAATTSAPDPAPSAARTLRKAVAEQTDQMPAPELADSGGNPAALNEHARPTVNRPRREDEITVVRPPFPKPDPARAAELAQLGTFDDEQTNVLSGDEVDLQGLDAAPASAKPIGERTTLDARPVAGGGEPAKVERANDGLGWRAFRVGIVAGADGAPRVVQASASTAVTAFIVPADAASAEALAALLATRNE